MKCVGLNLELIYFLGSVWGGLVFFCFVLVFCFCGVVLLFFKNFFEGSIGLKVCREII